MLKRRSQRKEIENAVKIAASKPDDDFVRDYLKSVPGGGPSPWTTSWSHPNTGTVYGLSLTQSCNTSDCDLDACFALVEETSRQDYEASSRGWNPKNKRKEMREPDLRYILVKDPAGNLGGFTSLMPTMEEGEAVVYCYEIHLRPELRRTGLAALLMSFLQTVANNIEIMEKVMLTVFTCNATALAFYRRYGFEMDDISPRPRTLRNGVVKEPDYVIMSKPVDRRRNLRREIGHGGTADSDESSMARPAKVAKV
ncbi:hypothetical protein M406DRAFT_109532 [Cryphonectria parasitica EP155]|uniref:N-alpha-acetyltransferase 40 n=1 Tax=Cryphonectria parasitica (strain ATCC 38755 / EP155) TaxID=660469 RepID=A0A9P4XW59_CRYP1|nr:uncharacterized protein M406DRAFT_109532 [Cryphonectria parasitica EP155]KAF3762074.1 hypothetical protein M406DRAFT_109532 [Cryphonectria parasitica EP155]